VPTRIAKSKMRISLSKKASKKKTKKLVLKKIKFNKTVKRMRVIARKTMKASLKGVPSVRKGLYKKIDVAIAKVIGEVVTMHVIEVVNKYLEKRGNTKTAKKATVE
jgi:hypothetical protein